MSRLGFLFVLAAVLVAGPAVSQEGADTSGTAPAAPDVESLSAPEPVEPAVEIEAIEVVEVLEPPPLSNVAVDVEVVNYYSPVKSELYDHRNLVEDEWLEENLLTGQLESAVPGPGELLLTATSGESGPIPVFPGTEQEALELIQTSSRAYDRILIVVELDYRTRRSNRTVQSESRVVAYTDVEGSPFPIIEFSRKIGEGPVNLRENTWTKMRQIVGMFESERQQRIDAAMEQEYEKWGGRPGVDEEGDADGTEGAAAAVARLGSPCKRAKNALQQLFEHLYYWSLNDIHVSDFIDAGYDEHALECKNPIEFRDLEDFPPEMGTATVDAETLNSTAKILLAVLAQRRLQVAVNTVEYQEAAAYVGALEEHYATLGIYAKEFWDEGWYTEAGPMLPDLGPGVWAGPFTIAGAPATDEAIDAFGTRLAMDESQAEALRAMRETARMRDLAAEAEE